jgi:hypothetical protein
MFCLNGGVVR